MFFKGNNIFNYKLDNEIYKVIVTKKNNKNTYIRINDKLEITVSTNSRNNNKNIIALLDTNKTFLRNTIEKVKKDIKKDQEFLILGEPKEIVIMKQFKNVKMVDNIIYTPDYNKLENWIKRETRTIFEERLKFIYDRFNEDIPLPDLKIRNMKTRWGVCNVTNVCITLNSKLIKEPLHALDYVIIHELSHLVHANHSKEFWDLVSIYCPQYKQIRKELKS